ncbi:hypothetical protein WN51_07944 [Melipona quadrifasciata]|uniref:Uncharacterized protein n=1 Tax=Melipona quadrifasciata TaxID=166423 RepID=A0A0M8ZR87_9HYME|nr:hypothetical protein WN51_07944 [Melipona quadrifasciata]
MGQHNAICESNLQSYHEQSEHSGLEQVAWQHANRKEASLELIIKKWWPMFRISYQCQFLSSQFLPFPMPIRFPIVPQRRSPKKPSRMSFLLSRDNDSMKDRGDRGAVDARLAANALKFKMEISNEIFITGWLEVGRAFFAASGISMFQKILGHSAIGKGRYKQNANILKKKNAKSINPKHKIPTINPNCLNIERAIIFLKSISKLAINLEINKM